MFTCMPHIVANHIIYMIRTFFDRKSGYRTKIIFLQLCKNEYGLLTLFDILITFCQCEKRMTEIVATNVVPSQPHEQIEFLCASQN